jgi:hypothetical protein
MAWTYTNPIYFAANTSGTMSVLPYAQDLYSARFRGPISAVMLPVRDPHRPPADNEERFNELMECQVLGMEQVYTGERSLGGADVSYAFGYRYWISYKLHGTGDMWARIFITSPDNFSYFDGNS